MSRRSPPKTTNVVPLNPPPDWQRSFQSASMRTSFCLQLTQSMLELLCAVADGVMWDRMYHFPAYGIAKPNNWIAPEQALIKRGLIWRVPVDQQPKYPLQEGFERGRQGLLDCLRLTPAGEAFVALLKVTGIFVKADAAIDKDARRR